MKYLVWMVILISGSNNLYAQLTKDQRIQDSVIGWDPKNVFDHYLKPQNTAVYQQKLAYVNKMAEWVKASYTPVGSLGEYTRYVKDLGFGLNLSTWNVGYDYLDEQKHFRPVPEENIPWYFAANRVFDAYDIEFINKVNTSHYFTMMPNGQVSTSTAQQKNDGMDKTISANVSNYKKWIGDWVTIYITPDNKLPMIPVTKGELLDKAATAMDGVFEKRKKDEEARWTSNPKALNEVLVVVKKEVDTYRGNIRNLKEKYKSSLNEPALVVDMQTDWRSFTAETWDIFYGGPNTTYYPVYKFDDAMVAKMKSAQPVWLTVAMPYATRNMGNREYELYTALTQNLDYDYVYNYFFSPEKVKNKSYVPANEKQLKARLAAYKSTHATNDNQASKKRMLPANVVLFDDFEETVIGSKPVGWYSGNYGKAAMIANVDGIDGKWLKLGDNEITSTTLKTLPQNFLLEFDVVTDKFEDRWGASLQLQLSGKSKGSDGVEYASSSELNITAGLQSALDAGHDYRGELRLQLINTPTKMDYNERGGYFAFAQPQFTSSKRKVHIKLEKINSNLFVYLNDTKVASSTEYKTMYGKDCGDCSIPSAIQYNKLGIRNTTNDAAITGCYISNIKITKK